ncbi:MAG TPA: hypothetical protein VGD46_08890 [Rhizobacter sp.]
MPRAGTTKQLLPVTKRLTDPAHERLLYAVQRDLPQLASRVLFEVDSLNAAMAARHDDLEAAVEQIIAEVPITEVKERRVWRKVPEVRYASPEPLPPAVFTLGCALQSVTDSRGEPRKRAEVLEICDFALVGRGWYWRGVRFAWIYRGSRKPLTRPECALEVDSAEPEVCLFGNVYPRGCALGEVAQHLTHVKEAVSVVEEERRDWRDPTGQQRQTRVLFVTDDAALYRALAPQAWGLLYQSDGRLLDQNLDGILGRGTVNVTPRIW